MKNICLLILLFIGTNLFGQSYKYKYKIELPKSSSYFYYQVDTNTNPVDSFTFKLKVIDEKNEPLEFISVTIISSFDTIETYTNEFGLISVNLKYDYLNINISHPSYTYFEANIPFYYKEEVKDFTVVLGKSLSLVIPIIKSKRLLSPKEINEVIEDIYYN